MRAALALPLVLSGCAVAAASAPEAVTQATRAAAKATVNRVASERFPGVPVAPVSDCVIDNASVAEILTMARFSVGAPDPRAVDAVLGVARRPDTIQCLADEGLPRLLTAAAVR